MINQKSNEFEEGISQLVSMNKEFVHNHKLKVIVSAHERIINQLAEAIKKQGEISKQLTIKGIVYTNMIAEKVTDYDMKFSGKLHKVKEVGSYISKNIEDCSNRLKNRFEDLRVKLADINKEKEHTYNLLCPDVDGYYHLLNLAPIIKDDLLGIYSFNRDKVKDDGCRTNYVGTNKAIDKLPEIIDGQEFFKWMSWNCALLNNII
ncbi:hypothetical protein [Paenibacillus sp. FSL H7-0331]|uniref:hypothetical protein n=1 Tax=Paenibacillus sp. FSL H7-0331 TaxID=1920421 RepID=UPI0015C2F1ED|nr:hypothetical protein [Paenibacillus sp. FSL H7-0331]